MSTMNLLEESKRTSFISSTCDLLVENYSQSEMDEASKAKEEKVEQLILLAEKTSLCFLVDCTGSMLPWINEVKKNIKIMSKQLHATHTHMKLHMAFVRYTDYDQPETTRTTMLDFTTDLDQFSHFVDNIKAPSSVGGDGAEDVFGGLDAMLKLSWPTEGTKALIHIADAPCHGTQYHGPTISDDYPEGDPGGLKLDDLMKRLADKDIAYYFGYIKKSSTAVMIKAFNSSLQAQSNKIHSVQSLDVSDPSKLLEGVFQSVTCSITKTLDALVSGGAKRPHDYTIDDKIPNWDNLEPQVVMITPPPTLGSAPKKEIPSQPMRVKIAPQPFSEGQQKIVFHALDVDKKEHIVLKQSKWADARSNSIKRCLETAEAHAIAVKFCAEFNQAKLFCINASEIQFVPVGIMKVADEHKKQYSFFTYETYFGGSDYIKFNSNFHYMPEHEDSILNNTCQAFSHFTWEKSGKQLVICDLQGVKFGPKVVLTDPVIHCTYILCLGSTNLGTKGIERVIQMHKCNDLCREMKLNPIVQEALATGGL